jgi:hypothetical protein
VRSYGSLEDRERSGREFVLFELRNLELAVGGLVLGSRRQR